jgi:predicted enzyme related to lactoylglutathione lyase
MKMAWSHGHLYWSELLTNDAERAKRFYTDMIGWSYQAMPMQVARPMDGNP